MEEKELEQEKTLEDEIKTGSEVSEIGEKEDENEIIEAPEKEEEEGLDDLEEGHSLRIRWRFFRKIIHSFFVIDSEAFNWSGECPNFEREVLFDKCKSCSFSFARLFWERVFNDTRPLNSSIRAKRY